MANNELVLTYTTPTASGSTRWVYRYFRSARSLARFLRTREVVEVLSIEEAQS